MSGVEVIGVIQELYLLVQDALKTYRGVTSGRQIESLQKDVATEEIIFREFLNAVLLPMLSTTNFLRLTPARPTLPASQGSAVDPSPPYALSLHEEDRGYEYSAPAMSPSPLERTGFSGEVSWQDFGLQASLESIFDPEKEQLILDTLEELQHQLRAIQTDVNASSTGSSSLRERLGTTLTAFRNARHGSILRELRELREKVEHLHHLNERLRRLFEPCRIPMEVGLGKNPQVQHDISHHDFHAMYYAIETGYCCNCQRPHPMKLGLPQINASPRREARSEGQSSPGVTGLSLLFSTEDKMSIETPEDTLSLVGSMESLRTNLRTSSHSLQRFESSGTLTSQDDHEIRTSHMMSSISSGTTLNSLNTRSSRQSSCAVSIVECNPDSSRVIRDLCDTVKLLNENSSPRPGMNMGVLRSKRGRKAYKLQMLRSPENLSSRDIISLEDLFASNQTRLSRKDRMGLALRLSQAVLRFYFTPWITESWSWRDFSMTRAEHSQDDCQLFISHDFYSVAQPSKQKESPILESVTETKAKTTLTSDFIATYIGEPILTRLGFALTELAMGKRLAELRTEMEQQIPDTEMRDFKTAKRILDSGFIGDEESERYEDVVDVCLMHRFRSKSLDLRCLNSRELSFQEDASQVIIAPLQEAWTKAWGSSTTQALY